MNRYTRGGFAIGIIVLAGALAACGGGSSDAAAQATSTNSAPMASIQSTRGADLHSATSVSANTLTSATPVTTTPVAPASPVPAPTGSGLHNLTLTWSAPSDNADGTPLVDLTGYKIRYGSAEGDFTQTITVANPGLNRYVVDNLGSGTYYFAISAYNHAGLESQLSGEVSATFN